MKQNYFEEIVSMENLKGAFLDLKENFFNPVSENYALGKLARGIDGDCFHVFGKGMNRKLKQIQKELREFTPPLPSLDLKIPKSSNPNKFRTISISALKEKIKHQAVCRVLRGKLEEIYADNLYSYRSRKGSYQAIKDFRKVVLFDKDPFYTYKVDMKDYFDNLDHKILLNIIDKHFKDKNLTKLIHVFIRQKRLSENELIESDKGVVQGISISADMANLYLSDLDNEMAKRTDLHYFRVGDDIIVLHKNRKELEKIALHIEAHVTAKKLPINREKTKISNPDESFKYLGYEIKNKTFSIAKRNCNKMKSKMRTKLNKKLTAHINREKINNDQLLYEIIKLIFPLETRVPDHLMWLRYFMLTNNTKQLKEIDDFIEDRIRLLYFGKKRNKNKNLLPLSKMRKYNYISLSKIYHDITQGRKSFHDYVKMLTTIKTKCT